MWNVCKSIIFSSLDFPKFSFSPELQHLGYEFLKSHEKLPRTQAKTAGLSLFLSRHGLVRHHSRLAAAKLKCVYILSRRLKELRKKEKLVYALVKLQH